MKKKSVSRRIFRIIIWILIVPIALIALINIPIITIFKNTNNQYYGNWMSDTLQDEDLVVDVAMLGAHDAFSADINLFSPLDELSADPIMMGTTGLLVRGFIVRQSVTQVSSVESLLLSGVRYLDIRLTYDDEVWYTKHNYISNVFTDQVSMITGFLDTHPGEFLILDFQHIDGLAYENEEDYQIFLDMLTDTGLFDYATIIDDLGSLTYGELTDNGTAGKVVILSKFADSSGEVLFYDDSIRSNWANSDDFEYIVDYLKDECESIDSGNVTDRFRVMQGVATMQMNGSGILKALGSWSLINRAKDFNAYLIAQEGFTDMLAQLPIVMVDFSNTEAGDFNTQIMDLIMDFNGNL